METVIVHRINRPSWEFVWDDDCYGLIHKTKNNIYQLFFENPAKTCKPIWIGRLVNNGTAWITVEKEIRAAYIDFCGSKVIFK